MLAKGQPANGCCSGEGDALRRRQCLSKVVPFEVEGACKTIRVSSMATTTYDWSVIASAILSNPETIGSQLSPAIAGSAVETRHFGARAAGLSELVAGRPQAATRLHFR